MQGGCVRNRRRRGAPGAQLDGVLDVRVLRAADEGDAWRGQRRLSCSSSILLSSVCAARCGDECARRRHRPRPAGAAGEPRRGADAVRRRVRRPQRSARMQLRMRPPCARCCDSARGGERHARNGTHTGGALRLALVPIIAPYGSGPHLPKPGAPCAVRHGVLRAVRHGQPVDSVLRVRCCAEWPGGGCTSVAVAAVRGHRAQRHGRRAAAARRARGGAAAPLGGGAPLSARVPRPTRLTLRVLLRRWPAPTSIGCRTRRCWCRSGGPRWTTALAWTCVSLQRLQPSPHLTRRNAHRLRR